MAQNALPDNNEIEKYKRILEQHEPYTPDDPEYRMLDGNADPARLAATLAKKKLEKLGLI